LDDLRQFTGNYSLARIIFYPFTVLGKVSVLAAALKLPDFSKVKFTRMEGDYTFRNGVMKIEKSLLRADAADADSSGSINLVKDTLDLKVTAAPKAGVSPPAPVRMTIKGALNDPSVKPDVSSILKQI
jgi:hypothetical protein